MSTADARQTSAPSQNGSSTPDDLELHHKAMTISRIYFEGNLRSNQAASYLAKRGIDQKAARKFELGYAPDVWRGLVDHFSSHRVRLAAKAAGLLATVGDTNRLIDFFRGRLMFPIRDDKGTLAGYGGRIISEDKDAPKYINTRETPLFEKGKILYGLHQHREQITKRREAILVEGYMDVIRLSSNGFDYSVAPMGTALTAPQIDLLAQAGVRRLWFCLDGDKAGQEAANRNIDTLMEHYQPALEVMVIRLPDPEDPDSLIREKGPEAFARCMESAISLPDHIHKLCSAGFSSTPCLEDKALYLVRIEPYIERAGGFLQHQLLKMASEYTGLPVGEINAGKRQREINEAVSKWHPLTTLAARWMVFDENSQRIAERMSRLTHKADGLAELAELGAQLVEGRKPSGQMHSFALAHGPLLPSEFQELHANWSRWIKQVHLKANLESLAKTPFDEGAKRNIRALLR